MSDPPSPDGELERMKTKDGYISARHILPSRSVSQPAELPLPVEAPKPVKVFIGVYTSATGGDLFSVNSDGTVSQPEHVPAYLLSKEKFKNNNFIFIPWSVHIPDGVVADQFKIAIPRCGCMECPNPPDIFRHHCLSFIYRVDKKGEMDILHWHKNGHASYADWDPNSIVILANIKEARKFLCPQKNQWLHELPSEDESIDELPSEDESLDKSAAVNSSHAGEGDHE